MSEFARETLARTNFTYWDWAIVAAYLGISVVIGVLAQRYAGSMQAYIGAGRSVGTWLGIATMTGTELGLVTVMYAAETGFNGGFAAFHIAVIAGLVTLFVGLTGFVVGPLRQHGVLTIPEFYEKRYGRRTRILGGILLSLAGILNMGLFLKLGAKFIVGVTGLPPDGTALPVVMSVLLALVLFYTVLGGMVSVIITDYVQFVVLAIGLLLTTFLAVRRLGWNEIFTAAEELRGEAYFNPFDSGGHFGSEYVTWMVVLGLVGCAVWPTAVARALAMESVTAVKRQFRWSAVSFVIRMMIPNFWGICAFVFIMSQADLQVLFFAVPLDSPDRLSAMDAMPIFLGRLLPAGIIGVISAAMIAAFMSTHDSYLLCWSSVITQDVIAPLSRKPVSDQRRILLTRCLIVAIGLFLWAWGIFYEGSDDLWSYMAITGAIYFTGAIPLLIGGLYWKRASSTGAFCALLAGCSAILGLEPLRRAYTKFLFRWENIPINDGDIALAMKQSITSERVGLFAIFLTVVVFIVISLLFPDRRDTSDKSKLSNHQGVES